MIYLGEIRLLAGFNIMTEQERSAYNISEVTSFMGVLCVVMSYASILMFFSVILSVIAIVAFSAVMVVMAFYVNIGKRFRADAQTKN
jgi:uncharacterized membrane protein YjgN (DUF898 family)